MENQKLDKINFKRTPLESEYYRCIFVDCDFAEERIDDVNFEECEFEGCNMSLTKFCSILHGVKFTECKMMGADFTEVNKFALSMRFEKCNLTYASFVEVKMKSTKFSACDLSDAYFDGANLDGADFADCELNHTSFHGADLQKANFATARNFTINPNNCKLKKAIFGELDLRGLLAHIDIKIVPFGQI